MTQIPEHLRITRITTVTEVANAPEEPDQRYRTLISLHRTDRPRYWTFSCINCKADICEMVNTDVLAISDLLDMQNVEIAGPGIRCTGRYCRRWYYFNLS